LKDAIIGYAGNGADFGVHIDYYEEKEPLGTVGGIKEIEDMLTEDFLVFYGDVMIDMNLPRLMKFHRDKKSDCTLVLHPNDHPFDSDLVETDDDGRVVAFHPKPHPEGFIYKNLVNSGAYFMSPEILPFLRKGQKADFGRDVFPAIYKKLKMFGYNTSEYLKDMGTPERLEQVRKDYVSGKIARSNFDKKQHAVFLDRDGVINIERSFIHSPGEMELYPFTARAVRKINESEYKAIVVTNQSVIARNLCTIEELNNVHKKMETDLGNKGAKIDALYYCPHHPDKGYPEERSEYKIDCMCRKPKPGMLLNAAEDYNIELTRSYMIGDSHRDILAGKNAGCITVGVMTGYGLKKTPVRPDYFFTNLEEAVSFIIDEPFAKAYNKIKDFTMKIPRIIVIGGNSRSGKSTLASYLQLKFEEEGLMTLKIELDNWILPEGERTPGMNVFHRFQQELMEKEIQQILSGIKIEKTIYPNHPDRIPLPVVYQYEGADIIIIEGVIALSSQTIRGLATVKVFIDVPDEVQKKRIKQYYLWRGKTEKEIENLYSRRFKDEYQIIKKAINFADFIVKN
jgi:histidinol-phosphate phosphatase family protein